MILSFLRYNITLGIPTPHFSDEEGQSLHTIQDNMAVDNNLYAVVQTASDYVSIEQFQHHLHLGIFQTVYTSSRWKLFMGLCLCFKIMVLLEMIRTNYSVPCQNQNGENALMTGFIKAYNPKCLMLSNYLFT